MKLDIVQRLLRAKKLKKETCETRGDTHHWMLEEPNGPITLGICKKCLDKKEFTNTQRVSAWTTRSERGL